jgi:hypothetical protein
MKLISLGIALAMICGTSSGLRGQERATKRKVFYFPIGAETLTPVTSSNIEQRGRFCEIRSTKNIYTIKNALDSAVSPLSQKFSDLTVRVKLIEATDMGDKLLAAVENDGEVRFATGKEAIISPRGMKAIKKVIETQCQK